MSWLWFDHSSLHVYKNGATKPHWHITPDHQKSSAGYPNSTVLDHHLQQRKIHFKTWKHEAQHLFLVNCHRCKYEGDCQPNLHRYVYFALRCLCTELWNDRADDRIALIARDSLDADEAVVYSSGDANVWEKRADEDLDADEAVVYSSEDANVWEWFRAVLCSERIEIRTVQWYLSFLVIVSVIPAIIIIHFFWAHKIISHFSSFGSSKNFIIGRYVLLRVSLGASPSAVCDDGEVTIDDPTKLDQKGSSKGSSAYLTNENDSDLLSSLDLLRQCMRTGVSCHPTEKSAGV